MNKSVKKGMELLSGKEGSDTASDNGRIVVSGYKTWLMSSDELEMALRRKFSTCGEITDVYIDEGYNNNISSEVLVCFGGEGAVGKALKLSGSDMGGWTVRVEPYREFICRSATANYSREVGTIIVYGYDSNIPCGEVEMALRKHFASCGDITDVYVRQMENPSFPSLAYVYFLGEGAVDKALKLSGMDVGGGTVHAKPYPKVEVDCKKRTVRFLVEGYDTKLSKADIKSALIEHFSPCGVIKSVSFHWSTAMVGIRGEDAEKKTLELNGSYMGGRKLVVKLYSPPAKPTVHHRTVRGLPVRRDLPGMKKAKMTAY